MIEDASLMSVDQVARRLGVQARTVRRYLRDGLLKGTRIGKQYRIAAADLAALTGQAAPVPAAPVRRTRHVEASAVVQIDAIAPADAMRIANGAVGAFRSRRGSSTPARLDTVYDEERARLKIILTGDLSAATGLMQLLESYVGEGAG